jgi:cobalt/nickel transport system permease protein
MIAPLAVHISEGVLPPSWLVGGFALAAPLVAAGLWRLADREVPRLALLTAAFFVASLIHVRVGPTSVHLLLNGLVGIILGWRSGLAVAVGLFLQATLIGHGGISALGVNTCVMTLPALFAAVMFAGLRRVPALQRPLGRGLLVAGVVVLWGLSLLIGIELALRWRRGEYTDWFTRLNESWALHPVTLAILAGVGVAAAVWERRLENAPDFPLGLLIGEMTVLLTVALNAFVLGAALPGGVERVAMIVFVAHLPLAVLEGVVCGFTVSFLLRVAPHFLAGSPASPLVEREQLVERHLPLPQPDADHG